MVVKESKNKKAKLRRAPSASKQDLIDWRKQKTVVRVKYPTRLDRAHSLGYKAKRGFSIVRVKIRKGGRRRRLYGRKGRKPKKAGLVKFTPDKSLRWIAEERAQKHYPNLEVLNSYYVGEDGVQKWFEIIMVDPRRPEIAKDKDVKWIASPKNRRRVYRGLTGAGKKARGLKK
jgi:large subunit ribosomal protein L15e